MHNPLKPALIPYVHVILQHEVAHEGETGKVSRANFHDLQGRTVLIMRPGKQVYTRIFFLMHV